MRIDSVWRWEEKEGCDGRFWCDLIWFVRWSVCRVCSGIVEEANAINHFLYHSNQLYSASFGFLLFLATACTLRAHIPSRILRKCMQFWTFSFDCRSFHLLYTVQVCAWKCTINQLNVNWNFKCERNSSFIFFSFWSMMIECNTTIESRQWKLQRWQPLCEMIGSFFFSFSKINIHVRPTLTFHWFGCEHEFYAHISQSTIS